MYRQLSLYIKEQADPSMSLVHDDKMENLLEMSRALLTKLEGQKTRDDWQHAFDEEARKLNAQNENSILDLRHRQEHEMQDLQQRHKKEIVDLQLEQKMKVGLYKGRLHEFWHRYNIENPRGP